jgi:hypothetical protein
MKSTLSVAVMGLILQFSIAPGVHAKSRRSPMREQRKQKRKTSSNFALPMK